MATEERQRMIEPNRAEHDGVRTKDIEANKQTVLEFYDLLINRKDFAAARAYLGSYYRQHNPLVAEGPEGLAVFVDFLRTEYPEARSEIKRVLGRRRPRDTARPFHAAAPSPWSGYHRDLPAGRGQDRRALGHDPRDSRDLGQSQRDVLENRSRRRCRSTD